MIYYVIAFLSGFITGIVLLFFIADYNFKKMGKAPKKRAELLSDEIRNGLKNKYSK